MKKALSTITLLTVASAMTLSGEVVETFNYTAGSVGSTAATAGTGETGNWGSFVFSGDVSGTANLEFVAGSYSAPTGYGFTPTNGKLETDGTNFNEVAVVGLTAANHVNFNSDSVVYMSFLVNAFRNGNTSSRISLVDSGNTSFASFGELNGAAVNLGNLGIQTSSGTNLSTGLMDAVADANGTQNLVVLKFTTSTTVDDLIQASFWDSATGTISGEPVSWAVSNSFAGTANGVALRFDTDDGFSNHAAGFDEIRIGNSFGAVAVPEPSTYALLAGMLALVAVMIRRR